jgi:hypothetical protein
MKVYPVFIRFLFVLFLASLLFLHKALPDAKKGHLKINQQAALAFEKEEGEDEEGKGKNGQSTMPAGCATNTKCCATR